MAFGNISEQLAVPRNATTEWTFFEFSLSAAGPPKLVCRHAGDGTPSFKRAQWHAANAERALRQSTTISEAKTKQKLYEEAKRLAEHCVISWQNVVEQDGSVPACTPDKVHEFLCAVIDADNGISIYAAFRNWISEDANFRPINADGADLGKP